MTQESLLQELSGGTPHPWPRSITLHVRSETQRFIYARLLPPPNGCAEQHLRQIHLADPPRIVADRVLRRIRYLAACVPPRVLAAVVSTIWNRWTTARGFQKRFTPACCCLLGCPRRAEDPIEHYLRYPRALALVFFWICVSFLTRGGFPTPRCVSERRPRALTTRGGGGGSEFV